ncbi:hypothetical protein GCM10027342_35880 [Photobacterium alginatilyticum]
MALNLLSIRDISFLNLDTARIFLDTDLDTNANPKPNCARINYCIDVQYSIEKPLLEQALNTNAMVSGKHYEQYK